MRRSTSTTTINNMAAPPPCKPNQIITRTGTIIGSQFELPVSSEVAGTFPVVVPLDVVRQDCADDVARLVPLLGDGVRSEKSEEKEDEEREEKEVTLVADFIELVAKRSSRVSNCASV
jgi:NACalpha-BTF3-like transcription factor